MSELVGEYVVMNPTHMQDILVGKVLNKNLKLPSEIY